MSGPYDQIVSAAAKQYGLNERVFTAQLNLESGFNPNAQGSSGELGIGQIMPDTWKGIIEAHPEIATMFGVSGTNPADRANAGANIYASAAYLSDQLKSSGGDYVVALARYNGGPLGETLSAAQDYAKRVLTAAGATQNANGSWQITESGPLSWVPGAGIIVDTTNAINGIVHPLSSIGDLVGWLTKPQHWWRILFIAAGGALVLVGLGIYLKPSIEEQLPIPLRAVA